MKTKHLQIGKARCFLLLLLMLPWVAGKAFAYDFSAVCSTGQTLYYTITDASNHYVEICCPGTEGVHGWDNYTKPTGTITLPTSVVYNDVSYVVTSIGEWAFYYCSGLMGSLTIPDSVTSIGNNAFDLCSGLTGSLTIPNSVISIGDYAFDLCSGLTGRLTIPNSVTSIGDYAFADCWDFRGSLTIGNSLASIGNNAFGYNEFSSIVVDSNNPYCYSDGNAIIRKSDKVLLVGCKNTVIPNDVCGIGDYAFYGCDCLTGSLTIPNSVTSIGDYAFLGFGSITAVALTIGNSLASIGNNAFGYNEFSSIVVDSNNPYCYSDGNAVIRKSDKVLLVGCKNTVIPNDVRGIGNYAFYGCSHLTGPLNIPDSVISIGDEAFSGCSGLTGSLTIPNSVISIGEWAFYYCSGLMGSLTIPNSVTSIGDEAFYYCRGLTGSLAIGNSLASIGIAAFGYNNFSSIAVDSNNPYCYSDGNAVIRKSDKVLLVGCKNTVIPNDVRGIGDCAFFHCSRLMGSLTIPNSVTSIGDEAFYYCSGLTGSLTIPDSVTSIGVLAFGSCSGLTGSLTIGNSVTSIGDEAFSASSLTSIISKAEVPPVAGSDCFGGVSTVIPIQVPCGSAEAYQQAAEWNGFSNYAETPFFIAISSSDETLGTVAFVQLPDCDGGQAIVKAIPAQGCSFVNWTENGQIVSAEETYSFTAVEDRVLVANFNGTGTGVEEYDSAPLGIYPNPASRNHPLTVDLPGASGNSPVVVEIHNATGQKVREFISTQSPVTIEGFETPGLYLIKAVIESDKITFGKVIVE